VPVHLEEESVLRTIGGKSPAVSESVFVEETAAVVGDVIIGDESSVWFHAVVRGDIDVIRIGMRTNLQDLCVVHVRHGKPVYIGDDITVGHRAILHGCSVQNRVLIGMGAIVLDGAVIGEESIVGAGSLVTTGANIPPRSLVLGSPARVRRAVTPLEVQSIVDSAQRYVAYALQYRVQGRNTTRNEMG
jgi:carbonic anhydrase/acetyltransferase-like protein (isoleucine patch superfamily)